VCRIIIAAAAAVVIVGGFHLGNIYFAHSETGLPKDAKKYKPLVTEFLGARHSFNGISELQEVNPDACAWITLDKTNIDFPVMYYDNRKYIDKDLYGNYYAGGSIFMDEGNSRHFDDFYSVIYGHYMSGDNPLTDNSGMFCDVMKFENKQYFEKHTTGSIVTEKGAASLEIMAFLKCSAYDPYIFESIYTEDFAKSELVEYIKTNSINYTEREIGENDKLIALSTCDPKSENSRGVVIAVVK